MLEILCTTISPYLHQPLPVCVQDVANAFFHSHQELKHLANPPKHSKIIEIVKKKQV